MKFGIFGFWRARLFVASFILISQLAFGSSSLKILNLNFNSEQVSADPQSVVRDQRFATLVNWVKMNDPDIITLQEAWDYRGDPSVGITLSKTLGYDLLYRLDMGDPGLMYDSNVILTKKELKLSEQNEIKLPHSALEFGDGKTWILVLGSVSYAIGAKLSVQNEPVYVYSTHLLGSDEDERLDQIHALQDAIHLQLKLDGVAFQDAKIIIAGDFNSASDSSILTSLINEGYHDSWAQAHPGDESCSYCGDPALPFFNPVALGAGLFPDQSSDLFSQRIDYIMVHGSELNTLASTLTFTSPTQGVWLSDHYALMSTVGLDGYNPSLPNPTRDSDESKNFPTWLTAIDYLFEHCVTVDPNGNCVEPMDDITVSNDEGLIVLNQGNSQITFTISGPGNVYTDSEVRLDQDHAASFTFEKNGDYEVKLVNAEGKIRYGVVHVQIDP